MFDSAQNKYLQLIDKDDGADTWFEDITTGCLNSSIKFTIG